MLGFISTPIQYNLTDKSTNHWKSYYYNRVLRVLTVAYSWYNGRMSISKAESAEREADE